jgi:hypothetical protein
MLPGAWASVDAGGGGLAHWTWSFWVTVSSNNGGPNGSAATLWQRSAVRGTGRLVGVVVRWEVC